MESLINELVIPIRELLGKKFFIPAYQRGYRWEGDQVNQLLDDIKDFSDKRGANSKDFYCLQPLVIKRQSKDCQLHNKCQECKGCEVLDGQQRITTILLVLKSIVERENKVEEYALGESFESSLFEINYQTRDGMKEFLSRNTEQMQIDADKYIDYRYIYDAAQTIKKWFTSAGTKPEKRSIFDVDFLNNSKVIWYEVAEDEDVIDAFTRLNMGKIRLTQAELVKSLFLNSSNFSGQEQETIHLRQIEIANEWDGIEYALQNEEFWGFIAPQTPYVTRIEYILDIVSGKQGGENFTFNFFYSKFKSHDFDIVKSSWIDVKRCFQTLKDWFEDKTYYHKIGYLLAVASQDICAIIDAWKCERMTFDSYLNKEINKDIVTLDDLVYGDPKVKRILLLSNLGTMLLNKNESSLFSFAKYKDEKQWDVEHIDSNTTNALDKKTDQNTWLGYAKEDLAMNNELMQDIEQFLKDKDANNFIELYNNIKNIAEEKEKDDDEKSGIGNLCLLDAGTNRAYKNALFPTKRKFILKRLREGKFVPICTQNLFLKAYSDSGNGLSLLKWGSEDKNSYKNQIELALNLFKC